MPDEFNKVVRIFDKHDKKKDSSVQEDEHGVFYVSAEKDENGNYFNSKHLINLADETVYIVRIMKIEADKPRMFSYRVSGSEIVAFISRYSDDNPKEKIIEINKCQPHNLA